ncbi:MAG: restriction endonuclease subunit S, partial [Sciscionella sp.]
MSWTEVEIKRVSRVSYGLGQPPKLSVNGIPIIRATNIHRGSITRDNLMYASLEDLPLNRAPLLMAGEILVVRSGAYTGDSALVTEEWEGSAPGYDLRVTPEHVEPRFIAYSLLGAHVQAQIRVANSRAAQPHLNAEEFGSIRITAPSVQEQRRIADFLDAETSRIDSMVTSQRQLRALLLERRVAQVHALVSGVKDSDRKQSKLTWLDTIPKTWASAKINFFARMGSGHTPSRSHPEWWTDCRVPWITTGEVSQIRDDRREIITETREKISKIGLANSAA